MKKKLPTEENYTACTEISREAHAAVEAARKRDDRSRSYVLRSIIHAWAKRKPKAGKQDVAS